jgi:hypothetical protein
MNDGIPSTNPSQNFQVFFLYVYNHVQQPKNTASKTAVVLLFGLGGFPNTAPHLMHLSASGKTSTPHELQNRSPFGGSIPHASQIFVSRSNFLPQFLQYT